MGSGTQLEGSTVMVTGGCGFIGSHLVHHLLARGVARVVIVDSLRYGDPANVGGVSGSVDLVRFTLGSDPAADLAQPMAGVDYLFHLAAEKHNQSLDDPARLLRSNVEGTHALFAAAASAGVRKVVFASSLYAYGRLVGPPFVEDEVPRPTTVYGISKLCGEHLLAHFAARGLRGNVLRYLFVYGPRQFAGMGYKSVIVRNGERLCAGLAPTVYGDGTQALDYVFVNDAVEATIAALEHDVAGEVFNIGSGTATTVNELLDTLIAVSGRGLAKESLPADWTAGSRRVGDVTKARRVLGWAARTPLAEGLAQTYRWIAGSTAGATQA